MSTACGGASTMNDERGESAADSCGSISPFDPSARDLMWEGISGGKGRE